MKTGSSVKSVAACFGLAAFAVAIVSGLAAGRTMQEILGGAIASLFVCFLIGTVIGVIGERTVQDGATRYTASGSEPDPQSDKAGDSPFKGTPA